MNTERPTPETDANIWASISGCIRGQHGEPIEQCYVPAVFARRLERERDVARENTKAWHGEYRALNDLHRELGLKHKKALRQLDEAMEKLTKVCEDEHKMAVEVANITAERDEAMELCDFNFKQLLAAINDRNSLGVQLDLLRDELKRIAARIGESGLGDNPYLSHISDYCQRAQKDIAVRYTPIEERDRACERLAVVSLQLDDCKAQRDRLLEALRVVLEDWKAGYRTEESGKSFDMASAAIAEVEGGR